MHFSPLRNRAFFHLLAFRLLIVLSYQIVAVVVGWHLYELTHDPLALGLVGLAEALPYFCCALFAGYAVDHHSRRLFGVAASLLLTFNALVLMALAAGWIHANPQGWIYSSIALAGVARAFIGPTYGALFAVIISRENYVRATGIGSTVFHFCLVAGPALGGLLVGWADKTTAYAVATVLAFLASIALFVMRVKEPPSAESAPVFTSIAEGLRFVFGNRIMLAAMSVDMFAVLFGGAVAMLPAFIRDIYLAGPEALGILRASPAVGAVLTGIVLSRFPINHHAGRWLLGSVAGFGMSIIAFGLCRDFWLAAFILLLSGVCDGISVVMRHTIYQLITPDAMRGRVSAINGIFIGSSNELGAFESGVAARLLGLVPSVVFGGVMTLVVVGVTARLSPGLRRLELHHLK